MRSLLWAWPGSRLFALQPEQFGQTHYFIEKKIAVMQGIHAVTECTALKSLPHRRSFGVAS